MHILIIPSWYSTPENPIRGSFFREQALALRRAGHQVGLIVPPSKLRTWNGLAEVRRCWRQPPTQVTVSDDEGLATYRIPWWGWLGSWYPPARAELGATVFDRYCAEQGRPDVIHAHGILYGGYLAAHLRQRRGIPAVVTEHSSVYVRRLVFPDQANHVRWTLRAADVLLAVSAPLADALRGFATGRAVQVIGNAVDTDFFSPGTQPLADSPFRFVLIASLNRNKGVDNLLSAFARAFAGQDIRLDIVGDGAERRRLEAQARNLGIASQVTFLGRLSRETVRDLLRQSHALVSSSYVETFGVTLIEALACGRPVVATRSGGADVLINDQNGLLVPTGDADALAAAMQRLVDTYGQYDPAVIRADCIARFSEAVIVRRLEGIYQELTEGQTSMGEFNPKRYWEERLRQHDGLVGVGYTRLGRSYNQWMYRLRKQVFRRHVRSLGLNFAGLKTLDVGAGTGFYVQLWQELGVRDITGVDLTQVAVENLQRLYPNYHFYEQNIAAPDLGALAEQTFDAISMFDVVFHIVDDDQYRQAFQNLFRLLKPGGYLIFSDFFVHAERSGETTPHVRTRSLRQAESVIQDAGFAIVRRAPLFVLMNTPVDTRSGIGRLAWKGLSALIGLHDAAGFGLGMLLYPLEKLLVNRLQESPSTEIMICRKP